MGARVAKFKRKAHGFRRNQDVRENDDGVNAETPKRLKGNFGGEIGSLAELEKRVIGANGAVFGKVAAGLAHHPDRDARCRFTTAGAEEQVLSIERRRGCGHRGPAEENSKSKE